MLQEQYRNLENRLLAEIRRHYGGRLVSVAVFGSVARKTQNPASDLDILIIAEGLPAGRMKRVAEFTEAVEDRLLPFLGALRKEGIDPEISPIFKTPEEAERGTPLFLDMVEDARILLDRENFFANILERLRNRLKALGSQRVWRGNAWYWVLKPDFKPGEVFEL
ncbi:MAG: nucleotidyltransferase domain-containing protein [Nitrospirae bacterium]|nr:nucleotidyltransferase domain-containing protein [Nitrospirota bacterium]